MITVLRNNSKVLAQEEKSLSIKLHRESKQKIMKAQRPKNLTNYHTAEPSQEISVTKNSGSKGKTFDFAKSLDYNDSRYSRTKKPVHTEENSYRRHKILNYNSGIKKSYNSHQSLGDTPSEPEEGIKTEEGMINFKVNKSQKAGIILDKDINGESTK